MHQNTNEYGVFVPRLIGPSPLIFKLSLMPHGIRNLFSAQAPQPFERPILLASASFLYPKKNQRTYYAAPSAKVRNSRIAAA
jgi:hypothetical protein